MVQLQNVNKFFFKKKKNEIHVINDTSLQLNGTGLVAFLGPNGCGKTTLLNVIGGLDKVSSGKVFINGERITGRTSSAVDKIRNKNIGYIFQNYNLVDNMTVFDNVAIALKMIGVKDKDEIEQKVNYVLEKVGMYRYRNRYADMLSGGERQRVAIARAIVKDPAIVIADEPTGNLDSKNTLEVMNIIKAISEDKLVILVTHEEDLAQFYASRIIRLRDGKVVSDMKNDHEDSLDYRLDNNIYLKDIKDHKRLKTDTYNIDFYNDSDSKVNLDIVIKNGNIYIRTNNDNDRIEIVDNNSSIELLDEKYKHITKEDVQEHEFDPEKLQIKTPRKYKSILNPFTMIKKGFKTVSEYNTLKKILLAGFFVSAVFITYSICNIFGVMNVTDDEFVVADKSYLTVLSKKVDVETYKKYEAREEFRYILPGNSMISLEMPFDEYFQTSLYSAVIEGSLSDAAKLTAQDTIYGRLPENPYEIVVDKMVLEDVIEEQMTKAAGYGSCDKFIDGRIEVANMQDFTIVGVSDLKSPCIYADQSVFINLMANTSGASKEGDDATNAQSSIKVIDYTLMTNDVTLKSGGAWPVNDYEVIVNEKNEEDMKIGKTVSDTVNGTNLKVVGYYSDKHDSDYMLVNNNTVKYALIKSKSDITICPENKVGTLHQLKTEGVNVKDTYEESAETYRRQMWSSMLSTLVMAGVILIISFIEIFLIIRASFLSRVKEIGVYRAIGVKKSDVYKMFTGEILAITTLVSLPGFILTAYILYKLSQMVYFAEMFLVTVPILLICIAVIYGLNLIFGLLPVFRIIRKTPAAILARPDVN